jgi:Uncharacterized protein conserved in bacteria
LNVQAESTVFPIHLPRHSKKMGKGVTLSKEELTRLKDVLGWGESLELETLCRMANGLDA